MTRRVWLSAEYALPVLYSCRAPGSGINTALALPAPGPATVRLALIKVGIELFGLEFTQERLFPEIRDARVAIRPPERIAISFHNIHIYKPASKSGQPPDETIAIREFAQTSGTLTIYMRVNMQAAELMTQILSGIGYWGQTNSFATCLKVRRASPIDGEVAVTADQCRTTHPLRYLCFVTEFRDHSVEWAEVMSEHGPFPGNFLRQQVFVWPLVIRKQRGGGRLLDRERL